MILLYTSSSAAVGFIKTNAPICLIETWNVFHLVACQGPSCPLVSMVSTEEKETRSTELNEGNRTGLSCGILPVIKEQLDLNTACLR